MTTDATLSQKGLSVNPALLCASADLRIRTDTITVKCSCSNLWTMTLLSQNIPPYMHEKNYSNRVKMSYINPD